MKHILAVYDVDPVYAARFAEVVNQKEKIPFEVVAFSSIERLRAFAAEHPVKLLLLGEHVPAEEKESIRWKGEETFCMLGSECRGRWLGCHRGRDRIVICILLESSGNSLPHLRTRDRVDG